MMQNCARKCGEFGVMRLHPSFIYFIVFGGLATFGPFLGVLLQDIFDLTAQQIGILMSVIPFMSFLSSPVCSYIFDLLNKNKFFWLGLIIVSTLVLESVLLASTFNQIFILIVIWSIVSAPVISFFDASVLRYLGDRKQDFGKHRLWGAISFGIMAFLMGFIMDYYPYSPFIGYATGFALYSILILFTSFDVPATIVTNKESVDESIADSRKNEEQKNEKTLSDEHSSKSLENATFVEEFPPSTPERELNLSDDDDNDEQPLLQVSVHAVTKIEDDTNINSIKDDTVSEKNQSRIKELLHIVGQPKVIVFYITVFIMGLGTRVIGSFLFLFLQDELNAPDGLLGMALFCSVIMEIPVFYFSGTLLRVFGVKWMIVSAMVAYIIRVTCYSFLYNPWLVLPLELLHGLVFGAMYAAATNFSSNLFPDHLSATGQGIFSGIYSGAGASAGGLVGGYLFDQYSPRIMFQVMAVIVSASLVLLCITERKELLDKLRDFVRFGKNCCNKFRKPVLVESEIELTTVGEPDE